MKETYYKPFGPTIGKYNLSKKKIEDAKQLNIKTIKESDWYKLLDL